MEDCSQLRPFDISADFSLIIVERGLENVVIILDGFVASSKLEDFITERREEVVRG